MERDPIQRVRRLALAAMLAEGGVPRPEQFKRAGLPPLFKASDMLIEIPEDRLSSIMREKHPNP